MRLLLRAGDALVPQVRRLTRRLEERVQKAIAEAGWTTQKMLRDQTKSALSERLARAWRLDVYPNVGASANAAAVVKARNKSAAKVFDAFDRGVPIHARGGRWLSVPTDAAGRIYGTGPEDPRLTPRVWERRTGHKLRFVRRRVGASWLIADDVTLNRRGVVRTRTFVSRSRRFAGQRRVRQGKASMVIFWMVKMVRSKKVIDFAGAADAGRTHLARGIDEALARA